MRRRRLLVPSLLLVLVGSSPAGAATLAKSIPSSSRPVRSPSSLGDYEYALVGAKPSSFGAKLALAAAGGRLISPALGIWRLPSGAARNVVARLSLLGALRYVEPDRPVSPATTHLTHGDPLATPDLAWHLYRIGADRVDPPGPGIPITILDAGLDVNHPDFVGRPNTIPLNAQEMPSYEASDYHGTFVASTAAAPANGIGTVGVYPDAVVRSYDIPVFTDSFIIEALDRAVAAGRSVINLSFGGPEPSRSLSNAVTRAFGNGSIVVASSGNDFMRGDPINFPAGYPHVLTVASTDKLDAPSLFSSSGRTIDVAAPGEGIPFMHPTDPNPRFLTGTSFAAPIVTAATAWVWTARPTLDKTQIVELLRASARDLAPAGFDPRTGFGELDIPAALTLPAPALDPQEPNDDIPQVIAGGLFTRAKNLLTTLRKPTARVRARLEVTEDPDDVYRVLVPARKKVVITVSSRDGDPGAILWHPRTRTVLTNNPAARRNWLAASDRKGTAAERLEYRNNGKKALVAFLDVWFPTRVEQRQLSYSVSIKTTR